MPGRVAADSATTKAPVPGPGMYKMVDSVIQRNGIKFGTEKRSGMVEREQAKIPGPGAYNSSLAAAKLDYIAKYKFGSSSRDQKGVVSSTPGPGTYQQMPKITKEGKKFSISGRPKSVGKAIMNSPGPGAYNPRTAIAPTTSQNKGFS